MGMFVIPDFEKAYGQHLNVIDIFNFYQPEKEEF